MTEDQRAPRGRDNDAKPEESESEILQRLTNEREALQREADKLAAQITEMSIDIDTRLGGGSLEALFERFGTDGRIETGRARMYSESDPVREALKRIGWDLGYYGSLYAEAPQPLLKWVRHNGEPVMANGTAPWSLPKENPDGTWTPGDWREVEGTIVTCDNGLHSTNLEHLELWRENYSNGNPMICCVVEIDGPVIQASGKYVARRMRLVRILPTPPRQDVIVQEFIDANFDELKKGITGLNPDDLKVLQSNPQNWDDYRKNRVQELMAQDHELQADTYRNPGNKVANKRKRTQLRAYRERLSLTNFDPITALSVARGVSFEEAKKVFDEFVRERLGV